MIIKYKSNGVWHIIDGVTRATYLIEKCGIPMGLMTNGPTEEQVEKSCEFSLDYTVRGQQFMQKFNDELYILNDDGKTIQVVCSSVGTPS